jgi:hypothetical protein
VLLAAHNDSRLPPRAGNSIPAGGCQTLKV